jgi:predicted nucleic acid-binding protein
LSTARWQSNGWSTKFLSDRAKQFRAEFENGLHELVAPDIFEVEVAHALTRAERQGRITASEASLLWGNVMAIPPRLELFSTMMPRAISLSSTLRLGVYDCLYVALAEREGCEFVSADSKLITNLQPSFPFIASLASL